MRPTSTSEGGSIRWLTTILSALTLAALADHPASARDQERQSFIEDFTFLADPGGRVSWSLTRGEIAYDRPGTDGKADILVMDPDGNFLRSLTDGNPAIPQGSNGNPEWHPSGDWLVFQSENRALPDAFPGRFGDFLESPGIGLNNDIWLMDPDGAQSWQVTQVVGGGGTLHPHFSPDGTKVFWSQIIGYHWWTGEEKWAIMVGDFFVAGGTPQVANIQTFRPEDQQMYETHEMSDDNRYIVYTSKNFGEFYYDMENYVLNVRTGEVARQITNNGDEWDEQTHLTGPTSLGSLLMWNSSEGTPQFKADNFIELMLFPPRLEFWAMALDGGIRQKVTDFNDPQSPDYLNSPDGVIIGDFCFGPDGRTLVVTMQHNGREKVARIRFMVL